MNGKDEFWNAWHRAGTDIKEKTNVEAPVTATRLMYLDDVQIGTVLRFNRCKEPTEEQKEQMKQAGPIGMLVGPFQHEEEEADYTVLDRRESGGMVSLILVDDRGEQIPHLDHGIKTVKAVVQ